MATTKGQI